MKTKEELQSDLAKYKFMRTFVIVVNLMLLLICLYLIFYKDSKVGIPLLAIIPASLLMIIPANKQLIRIRAELIEQ